MTREIIIGVLAGIAVALLGFLGAVLSQGALVSALGGVVDEEVDDQDVAERLAALRDKVAALEARGTVPAGAVVAFDDDSCPGDGWSTFWPATSRVIIGAGDPSQLAEERFPLDARMINLTPRKYREHRGGEEAHALELAELPVQSATMSTVPEDLSIPGIGELELASEPVLRAAPDAGEAHNTMPPFIALSFCQYEGAEG